MILAVKEAIKPSKGCQCCKRFEKEMLVLYFANLNFKMNLIRREPVFEKKEENKE